MQSHEEEEIPYIERKQAEEDNPSRDRKLSGEVRFDDIARLQAEGADADRPVRREEEELARNVDRRFGSKEVFAEENEIVAFFLHRWNE